MGSGGVVQDDLEHLGAEEVGQSVCALVEASMLFGNGVGGGRRVVVS